MINFIYTGTLYFLSYQYVDRNSQFELQEFSEEDISVWPY